MTAASRSLRFASRALACIIAATGLLCSPAGGQCVLHESAKLLASDGAAGDWFGGPSIRGDVAIVGPYGDDDNGSESGSAYVYRFDGTAWNEEAKLLSSDGSIGDNLGIWVSISGDVAIVGADADDNGNGVDAGSAYVFRYDGATWTQEAKLLAADGAAADLFGNQVSLSGDAVILGARRDDDNGADSGSAYVFRYDGTTWTQEAKLLASDGATKDYFGWAVSISGDVAIVGAYWDDDNGNYSGSAYVYRFDGSTWNEEAKLLASDGAPGDEFGRSVSLPGTMPASLAIVGAPGDDDDGEGSGSAYVYRYDGAAWVEQAKLRASDGAAGDDFGRSVSLPDPMSDPVAVVGAPGDDDNGMDAGSAYVFRYDGSTWNEQGKLLASDGALGDAFGQEVSVSGVTAIVSAELDDDNGNDSGSAYVFDVGGSACAETICPDDPGDYVKSFGGPVTGDALDLCGSDDVRLEVRQMAQVSPLLPFIQLEFWAHSTFAGAPITSIEYTIEGHVSALVAGGQNPDTLRTSIRNYAAAWELIDQRGTAAGADAIITHAQATNAPDYVNAGDGEVRVRQEVWNPGLVFTPNWFLKVDEYEVTVSQ